MQALELELSGFEIRTSQMIDGGQRLRIMRCKLRENSICRRKELACACNVGNVGMYLAGINREVFQTVNLCALDFGVPISTLH